MRTTLDIDDELLRMRNRQPRARARRSPGSSRRRCGGS